MKRVRIVLSSLMFLAVAAYTPLQAYAAASNGIGVNPRRNYTVNPGDKITDTLFINNTDKTNPLRVKAVVIDFVSQNQTGTPSLLLKQKEPTRYSLKPYLTIPSEFDIPAGKYKEVPFTVAIPANVGAGSYYSAISFSAVNEASGSSGSNVNLTGAAVTLMFVRVNGEAKSNLSLEKFGTFTPNKNMTDGAYGTFYSATRPKYVSYLLRNNGNLAEQPAGSLIIKDVFGKNYKLFQDANPSKNLVIIGQTRRIDLCLNEVKKAGRDTTANADFAKTTCEYPNLKPGRYTASLKLIYGDPGNSQGDIKKTMVFWYLPPWFIIAAIISVALLIALVNLAIRKFNNRNAHKFRGR